MNTQQALQLAIQKLNGGDLQNAGLLFESVLAHEPHNFAALNGRGFIALQQNRLSQSAADFSQSLLINAQQVFAQKMLAIVLGAMGRFEQSMQAFDAALKLDPKDPEIYFNRANFCFQAGQVAEPLADLDEAIRLKPSYLEARSNRANLLMQREAYALAEKDLTYITDKVKNNPDLWIALGLARHKLGKHKEALQANARALQLNPQHPDALMNNSNIACDIQKFDEAVSWAEKAILETPHRAEAHYSLAKALAEIAQFDRALQSYNQALQLNPNYAEAYMGRGLVQASLRDPEGAIADYDQALRLKPDYGDALFNKSYMSLEHREFAQGWAGYEHRLGFPKFKDSLLANIPKWNGEAIDGVLLVRGEQGLGDQVLFASVLPDLTQRQKHIHLQVEPRLVSLFQRSFPGCMVSSKIDKAPANIVAQIPLGSLPQYFRQSVADFKAAQVPYLKADTDKTQILRQQLAPNGEKIIGINWRSLNNRFAGEKSIQLTDLAPLFKIPGCIFVNLQYGDTQAEIQAATSQGIHFSDRVKVDLTKDIDGVASLVDACDLIVSVSNSTVHLAGALGKDVLLMLPHRVGKLWYWSEAAGENSLWYPTIKTFHQSAQGEWDCALTYVHEELTQRVY